MITNSRLQEIASKQYPYGKAAKLVIMPPRGVDDLPHEWLEKLGSVELEQPYVYEIPDVKLVGPALAGFQGKELILETSYFGRIDLWERNFPYFETAVLMDYGDTEEIDVAFSACTVWSNNYFHWILDILPKLEALDVYEKETGVKPVILVGKNIPVFAEDLLNMVGANYKKINSYKYHVNKLVVPTTRRERGYIHPSAIKYLGGLFEYDKMTSKKIYISRRYADKRKVINENALCEVLLDDGYACITPEKYSMKEQIGIFRNAEWIIAPHGAGLANIAWCINPDVRIMELVTPDYSNPCCWLVAACMNWNYGYHVGQPLPGENLKVNLNTVDMVSRRLFYKN